MVLLSSDLAGYDVTLVSDATLSLVGSALVSRSAYDQHKLVLSYCALHERGQLITWRNAPLIKYDIHPISAQARSEIPNPIPMGFIVP
jgi:hypothetical protein